MSESLIKLIILFLLIIDPLLSLVFFITNTKNLNKKDKFAIAYKSIFFAVGIAFLFLFFGHTILTLFSIDLNHFKIAGGIILLILGIKMSLGITYKNNIEEKTTKNVISTIIATPLLSGPACITTIIISSAEYGQLIAGIALSVVFLLTGILLIIASVLNIKKIGVTGIKMVTSILGLITISWAVNFILTGLGT